MTTPQPPKPKISRNALIVIAVIVILAVGGCCIGAFAAADDEPDDQGSRPATTSAPAADPPAAPAPATTAALAAVPTVAPASATVPTTPVVPKTVAVPNLVGKNAAVADDELRKLGFTNISFGSQDKDDKVVILLANWTVTKQSTKAGAKVPVDTLIVLTCTKE